MTLPSGASECKFMWIRLPSSAPSTGSFQMLRPDKAVMTHECDVDANNAGNGVSGLSPRRPLTSAWRQGKNNTVKVRCKRKMKRRVCRQGSHPAGFHAIIQLSLRAVDLLLSDRSQSEKRRTGACGEHGDGRGKQLRSENARLRNEIGNTLIFRFDPVAGR